MIRSPFTGPRLAAAAAEHGIPLWVYDAQTIRDQIAKLKRFDVVRFAQKACSNVHVLRLMREEGVHVDAVSAGEIDRALAAGYTTGETEPIVFTADLLDRHTLDKVVEHDIPVNAGSPQMLQQVGERHRGHQVWLRINPEVMFDNGTSRLIRRRQTVDELLALELNSSV